MFEYTLIKILKRGYLFWTYFFFRDGLDCFDFFDIKGCSKFESVRVNGVRALK